MKLISLVTMVLSFSFPAFAFPTVGDEALFDLTQTDSSGNTLQGTYEVEILGYDSTMHRYEQRSTQILDGDTSVQEGETDENQFYSDSVVTDILNRCAQYGGVLETVTVPAGTFNTCAVPYSDAYGTRGITLYTHVPYSTAKQTRTNSFNQTVSLTLRSFHSGPGLLHSL